MPAMVRTRFSTPTIGREWMIGEMGRAVTAIDPDGTVQVRDALWRAYTNRATPIDELDRVRVIGIEGLVLEVEPEEGAARDYRERGPKAAPDGRARPTARRPLIGRLTGRSVTAAAAVTARRQASVAMSSTALTKVHPLWGRNGRL